ncbi:nuclear receptor-binding protein homolog isoform X3 [Bacillus rossius redtenbacheri]|uniref:nuclear receptor-binding protein homolog isoform X3 n=1 Tax=Bacillus rossius redtenbacheri TaxID=93214 RepID=UPI002FDC992E
MVYWVEVEQRDVPGIDSAYLAMDTEEGVEVVWNEVQFSERKNFKAQEEKIQQVFENLTRLEHPNIVKFHRYWTDTHNDKPRVIFITEYMSSGSLKQFLKRTKRNVKKLPLQAWKRWCTQILSALSYLHSCSPPIIHGNLTCDTIFIQHNGLVKIGSVAPDAIHHHVKTYRDNMKNMHFIAPEYAVSVTTAIDVYAFGMCALEMAALEIQGNGDSGTLVTEDDISRTIESLDDERQRDFVKRCLAREPTDRPSARELLFHPLVFEVHPLKLLAAHALVHSTANISETITDEVVQRLFGPDVVVAEIVHPDRPGVQMKMGDIPVAEKLEKFVEDVKYGIYPLTAFSARLPPPPRPRPVTPEMTESVKSVTPEPQDLEVRRVVNMMCNVKPREDSTELLMTILLRMDDKMNRQLTCCLSDGDNSLQLAQELVHFGFINEDDREKLATLIEEALRNCFNNPSLSPSSSTAIYPPPEQQQFSEQFLPPQISILQQIPSQLQPLLQQQCPQQQQAPSQQYQQQEMSQQPQYQQLPFQQQQQVLTQQQQLPPPQQQQQQQVPLQQQQVPQQQQQQVPQQQQQQVPQQQQQQVPQQQQQVPQQQQQVPQQQQQVPQQQQQQVPQQQQQQVPQQQQQVPPQQQQVPSQQQQTAVPPQQQQTAVPPQHQQTAVPPQQQQTAVPPQQQQTAVPPQQQQTAVPPQQQQTAVPPQQQQTAEPPQPQQQAAPQQQQQAPPQQLPSQQLQLPVTPQQLPLQQQPILPQEIPSQQQVLPIPPQQHYSQQVLPLEQPLVPSSQQPLLPPHSQLPVDSQLLESQLKDPQLIEAPLDPQLLDQQLLQLQLQQQGLFHPDQEPVLQQPAVFSQEQALLQPQQQLPEPPLVLPQQQPEISTS